MKILFLITTFNSKARYHPGIASLSAFLKKRGHQTDLLSVKSMDFSSIKDFIKSYSPDVIAGSTNSHQYYYMKKILPFIRENFPNIKIILGGVHPTLDGSVINEIEALDAICRGEGEMPLLQYAAALHEGRNTWDIPNITLRTNGDIKENDISYYVEDLDSLPYPDYSIFPLFKSKELTFPMRFLFNRGCPFNCTYCCNHKFKELFPERKNYVRYKSPQRVVDEILYFSDKYDFGHYVVDDDVFTLNKKWLLEFCNLYPERLKDKTFEANVRVGTADKDMLKALKDIGCSLIKIGVESGSESLRKQILGRNIPQKKIIETADLVKSLGLKLHTFNMIGVPNETRQDVWKTIKLNRAIVPDKTQLTVFYPYKNTTLGDHCLNNGLVNRERADTYFTESILKFNPLRLSYKEVVHFVDLFKFYVYIGRKNKVAVKALRSFVKSIPQKAAKSFIKIRKLSPKMRNFIEKSLVRLNNKEGLSIFKKPVYKILQFLYLSNRKADSGNSSWEEGYVGRAFLDEFKDIIARQDYTEHGILNTEAYFIYSFLRKDQPDIVIESGTYKGYSSLFIAEALKRNKKGRFITISVNKDNCLSIARKRLSGFPFTNVIEGKSQEVLGREFDRIDKKARALIFIDGPKGSSKDFDELLLLLKNKIKEGYDINTILVHDCEEHIPIGYNKRVPNGYVNPTRLKTEFFYKRYFSEDNHLRFMTNEFYEKYNFLDENIYSIPNTDILPYDFKKGRQVCYGTAIALIRKARRTEYSNGQEELNYWKKAGINKGDSFYSKYMDIFDLSHEYLNNKNIGDFGSGPFGGVISAISNYRSAFPIDILADQYNQMGLSKEKILKFDGKRTTLASGCIDVMFCCNAIDHTRYPGNIVKEIHRLLADNSELFLSVHLRDKARTNRAHPVAWDERLFKKLFKKFQVSWMRVEDFDRINYKSGLRILYAKLVK